MRVAFTGASDLSVAAAELLIKQGHEVIIIERDQEVIERLDQELDCAFLLGDGSSPQVLSEVNPEITDVLFCLTDSDQTNLISSLLGRSLGFGRTITKIIDPSFENICHELGLEDTIVPSRTIARYLADTLKGQDILELSTVFKGEARLFSFTADKNDEMKVEELELPEGARAICYFREGKYALADPDTMLRKSDEVVILTHSDNLPDLRERWKPEANGESEE